MMSNAFGQRIPTPSLSHSRSPPMLVPLGPGTRCVMLLSLALLAGCTASSNLPPAGQADPAPGTKGTIGVSVLTLTNPFFKVIGDNITTEMKKAGYETDVVSGDMDI